MRVNDDIGGLGIQQEGICVAARPVFDEHRVAGRFEEENGSVLRVLYEQCQIVLAEICSFVEIALAEGGTAAAFASNRQRDFKARSFKDFHRRDADMWFMVADEGIIPQNDASARGL